jgi:hypothetical protein
MQRGMVSNVVGCKGLMHVAVEELWLSFNPAVLAVQAGGGGAGRRKGEVVGDGAVVVGVGG